MEENPYKAPQVEEVEAEGLISDPERIRRLHLKHEASLKGMGTLLILGAVLVGISFLGLFAAMPVSQGGGMSLPQGPELVIMGVLLLFVVLQLVVGVGLRRLAPWSWIPGIIVAAISIINFPIGTVIGGYFLYLLVAPKGRRVLAADYREIVRQTPHIKYRTPIWLWVLLLVLVLAVVGSLLWFSIG